VEFARTPLSSHPTRDSGESHYDSGKNPTTARLEPVKPVLETEAMYELVDCGGVADTDDARRSAWKALLCGCAGYT